MKACHDGMLIPLTKLAAATGTISAHGFRQPARHSNHSASATSAIRICVTNSTFRRGYRSATMPPSGDIGTEGSKDTTAANPTQVTDPVASKMTYGTARFCIHEPMFDTSAAIQKTRKSRCAKASRGPAATAAVTGIVAMCNQKYPELLREWHL